jgi:hypothetical protein
MGSIRDPSIRSYLEESLTIPHDAKGAVVGGHIHCAIPAPTSTDSGSLTVHGWRPEWHNTSASLGKEHVVEAMVCGSTRN